MNKTLKELEIAEAVKVLEKHESRLNALCRSGVIAEQARELVDSKNDERLGAVERHALATEKGLELLEEKSAAVGKVRDERLGDVERIAKELDDDIIKLAKVTENLASTVEGRLNDHTAKIKDTASAALQNMDNIEKNAGRLDALAATIAGMSTALDKCVEMSADALGGRDMTIVDTWKADTLVRVDALEGAHRYTTRWFNDINARHESRLDALEDNAKPDKDALDALASRVQQLEAWSGLNATRWTANDDAVKDLMGRVALLEEMLATAWVKLDNVSADAKADVAKLDKNVTDLAGKVGRLDDHAADALARSHANSEGLERMKTWAEAIDAWTDRVVNMLGAKEPAEEPANAKAKEPAHEPAVTLGADYADGGRVFQFAEGGEVTRADVSRVTAERLLATGWKTLGYETIKIREVHGVELAAVKRDGEWYIDSGLNNDDIHVRSMAELDAVCWGVTHAAGWLARASEMSYIKDVARGALATLRGADMHTMGEAVADVEDALATIVKK